MAESLRGPELANCSLASWEVVPPWGQRLHWAVVQLRRSRCLMEFATVAECYLGLPKKRGTGQSGARGRCLCIFECIGIERRSAAVPAETTWQVPLSGWKERLATHVRKVSDGIECRSDHRTNLTIVISISRLDAKNAKGRGFARSFYCQPTDLPVISGKASTPVSITLDVCFGQKISRQG